MNIKKMLTSITISILMLSLIIVPAFASNGLGKNWRVYNVKPATNSFWDINKLASDGSFPIQQFDTKTTGSFAVYVLNNYNIDMTDATLFTDVSWTSGVYETRSTACSGAYVRFEFQDVTAGPYDSNDYWWSTVNLDLNALTSGTLEASLAERALWTNQNGLSATDTTSDWTDWTGDIVAMSPYNGFTKAVQDVKQVGLSFGSSCTYASGVALDGGAGTFTMSDFTINP